MKQTFGERVVALRETRGITSTAKLARLVKISQPSMWAIENGTTVPNDIKAGTLMALAGVLRTTAEQLWTGNDNSPTPATTVDEIFRLAGRIAAMPERERLLVAKIMSANHVPDERLTGGPFDATGKVLLPPPPKKATVAKRVKRKRPQ